MPKLTEWAYPLAEFLLAEPLPRRWKHCLGVAERARTVALILDQDMLRAHERQQQAERAAAGDKWTDEGWLFATETGRGTSPRTDYDDWKELLSSAKVRDGRLHDARHTAATVLLILGVSERAASV